MIIKPILDQQNQFNLKLLSEIKEIKSSSKQIEDKQDYYTIKAYANLKKINMPLSNAKLLGIEASSISRERNIKIGKIPDERFGQVNSYHIEVLEEVFKL
jgi:hypothetical protein